ncbi:MAG: sel1 repeat family protein [Lachnospiraceae bacterium]|nr:sel1 repeat family protein [Lachnospiraceae bacterium]
MQIADALNITKEYYERTNPTESEDFMFTEALSFLIEETKDAQYMTELAWFYCTKQQFDLERKYLEMAAECGNLWAMEELGYMWYYGQHGEVDYEKAFYYFSKGAQQTTGSGRLWCTYKLADMYRFALAVEKSEETYRRMIRSAYEEVKNPKYLNEPFPEIAYRLAGILVDEGDVKQAVEILKRAKRFLAERLSYEPFWGHFETMERIVRRLYALTEFDPRRFGFYDIFELTRTYGTVYFKCDRTKYSLEIAKEDGSIYFDGRWYRSFAQLCQKAEIGGEKITRRYDEFYDWEVAA